MMKLKNSLNNYKFIVLLLFILCFTTESFIQSRELYAKEITYNDRIILSLGDSYSAGEGLGDYYYQEVPFEEKANNQKKYEDWFAHRSKNSWPGKLKLKGVDGELGKNRGTHWFFAASTGAKTENITSKKQKQDYNREGKKGLAEIPVQLDILKDKKLKGKKIDFITITIGGNDLGFENVVSSVTGGSATMEKKRIEAVTSVTMFAPLNCWYINFGGLKQKLVNAHKDISVGGKVRKKIKNTYVEIIKQTKDFGAPHIIVAGYPCLYNSSGKGITVSQEEANLVNGEIEFFNEQLSNIVNECKTADFEKISFVDVAPHFKGYEAYSETPYIEKVQFLKNDQDFESTGIGSSKSMHPNSAGAEVYKELVQNEIEYYDKIYHPEYYTEENNISKSASENADKEVTSSENADSWRYEYINKLEEFNGNYGSLGISAYLYDFNNDGIPEMFLYGEEGGDGCVYGYSYKDGTINNMDTQGIGLLESSFYVNEDYVIETVFSYVVDERIYIYKRTNEELQCIGRYVIEMADREEGNPVLAWNEESYNEESLEEDAVDIISIIKGYGFECYCDDYNQEQFPSQVFVECNDTSEQVEKISGYDEIIAAINMFDNKDYSRTQEELYKDILNAYCDAFDSSLIDDFDSVQDFKETYDIYGDPFYSDPYDMYRYTFKDINGDGIDELFILSNDIINQVFTIKNGKLINLINGWSRKRLYLLDDNTLYSEGSSSAATAYYESWMINSSADKIELIEGYMLDASELMTGEISSEEVSGDDFWFYYTDEDSYINKTEKVSKKEADEYITYKNAKIVELKGTYFRSYK